MRAAYSSGKPAYGVGPGNVPAFVERTADIVKAARDIVSGKTFDNGVLCSSENAVVADQPIAGLLIEQMKSNGAFFCEEEAASRLARFAVRADGSLNTAIVGKSAEIIASMAGITVPAGTRCLVARLNGVGREHPLSREKLSPILAFYVEDGWEACCRRVLEILRYGGMGHTMSIHSQDRDIIMKFALTKPVFRICVNTPAAVGAVGLTTGLEPSMTLGCGALGGNITSDNIMPRHLINLKRLAFETRTYEEAVAGASAPPRAAAPPIFQMAAHRAPTPTAAQVAAASAAPSASPAPPAPRSEVEQTAALRERIARVIETHRLAAPTAAILPRMSSQPTGSGGAAGSPGAVARESRQSAAPVPFVSEADVRQAVNEKRCIAVDARTIITPSARDLGQEHRVFQYV